MSKWDGRKDSGLRGLKISAVLIRRVFGAQVVRLCPSLFPAVQRDVLARARGRPWPRREPWGQRHPRDPWDPRSRWIQRRKGGVPEGNLRGVLDTQLQAVFVEFPELWHRSWENCRK